MENPVDVMQSMCRSARTHLGMVCLPVLLLSAVSAFAEDTLEPGGRLAFELPGATTASCDAPTPNAVCVAQDGGAGSIQLGSFAVGSHFQGSAVAEGLEQLDFSVAPGFGRSSVLEAQISGSLNVDGVVILVGIGETSASATMELWDVTDAAAPQMVATHRVFKQVFSGDFAPELGGGVSAGLGLGADIGAPHGASGSVDVSADVGVDVSFPLDVRTKDLVESFDFGFDALVQRGHHYRVQLRSLAVAEGRLGGIAWSQLGPLPSSGQLPAGLQMLAANGPFSLATFFEAGKEVFGDNPGIPSIPIDVNVKQRLRQFQPVLDKLTGLIDFNIADDFPAVTLSANTDDIFGQIPGLPRNVNGIATDLLGFGAPALSEFDREGIQLTQLSVLLESDVYEDVRRLEIERDLASCRGVVSNLLPQASGGRFEEVMLVEQNLIEAAKAAGLGVDRSERLFARAEAMSREGRFKAAYGSLCLAYGGLR